MTYPYQPWRAKYQPASYGGAGFHVEVDSQSGGRRNATHEFPHRDTPWTEDMGRKARRWPITAYLIGPNYTDARDALISVCEQEGPFQLVHPLLGQMQANCDDYTCVERRELGGYCIFELKFVEAGSNPGVVATSDTQSQVAGAGTTSDTAAVNSGNTTLGGPSAGGIASDTVAAQEAGAGGLSSGTPSGSAGIGMN